MSVERSNGSFPGRAHVLVFMQIAECGSHIMSHRQAIDHQLIQSLLFLFIGSATQQGPMVMSFPFVLPSFESYIQCLAQAIHENEEILFQGISLGYTSNFN